jgi:NADH:ubiquinone oxidoreductase subunit 6 (subunit J)
MSLSSIIFYLLSSGAIISSIMVITARNPIHSVLFLVLVFFNVAGLLILVDIEFLAIMFLIIYVGAIGILFLFVVMMLNVKVTELNDSFIRYLPIGAIIGFIFLFEVFLVIDNDLVPIIQLSAIEELVDPYSLKIWASNVDNVTNIVSLGQIIYTYHYYNFLVASLILLVAMIGAIVLTLHKRSVTVRQKVYDQVARDLKKAIFIRK